MPLTVGDQVGRIIGARPGTTCMHQNVTVAVAVVLSCFRLEPPRNRIVYVEASSRRCATCSRPSRGGDRGRPGPGRRCLDAIDERTLLVPLSHVLFKTAELQDVEADPAPCRGGRRARAARRVPVGRAPSRSTSSVGVAFAAGGSVKWLCGGPGAGWLYVRPDLLDELEPAFVGWQGHARPFAFEPELEYADGIARFLTGTPNVPALYAATAGYDVIEEVGVEGDPRALARPHRPADRARGRGRVRGHVPARPARRGASVTIRVPGFEGVHKELAERQILCDFRPDVGLRLGPHFFNSEDELEHAIAPIGEILASGAHERHLGAAARF